MKSKSIKHHLTLLVVALGASAYAVPPIVDSTGVRKSVVSTLVMPAAGMTEKNVRTIIDSNSFGIGGSNIPPGYKEVQVPMSVHDIGLGVGTYGLSYYTGLGYPVVQSSVDCQGNFSPRVLAFAGTCTQQGDNGCTPGPPSYMVCEPVGTSSVSPPARCRSLIVMPSDWHSFPRL